MDACAAVDKEIDKVLYKFSGINEHTDRVLQDLTNHIVNLKNELENAPPDHQLTPGQASLLRDAMNKIKETAQVLATEHRDLHSTVSKVGKAIDRNFVADFAQTSRDGVFDGPEKQQLLHQVICKHFYRQGLQEIAEEFASEAGIKSESSIMEPFVELNRILECLKNHDLDPALEWAATHRESLEAQHSSLEFKLHRLRFIDLIQQGPSRQEDAIHYARKYFNQFVLKHEKEIQCLMGMFLYIPKGIASSPYGYLLDPSLWADAYDAFTRDACTLLGLSVDSPLSICVNAGCVALPALINLKRVMEQRQLGLWNSKEELPIEIDLGENHRYHSVFACPILRQQSTENNPPMKLVCGHVISRDALNKLCQGNKLKCPYCPVEQTPADARHIFF